MKINVGQHAPNFKAFDSDRNEINLADLKGEKILLLFYPAAFSGGCTTELCSVRDDISVYDNMNAKVFGISTDAVFTLKKFKELEKLNMTLLSDYNKDISEAYGTSYKEFILGMKGTSKRSAFVIDEDGIVRYAEILEKASDMPDFDAIKRALSGIYA